MLRHAYVLQRISRYRDHISEISRLQFADLLSPSLYAEQATGAQSEVATFKLVIDSNSTDNQSTERLTFTRRHAMTVEELSDLRIGMSVKKSIDFPNDSI
jgi:hypothetical protein